MNTFAAYQKEKELATRLRNSTKEQRNTLYQQIYQEYFDTFPGEMERAGNPKRELSVIKNFLKPGMAFLEIGSGTGELAKAVSKIPTTVTTLDLTSTENTLNQSHVSRLTFNGITTRLKKNHFDIAYSNQVIEHIHPADIDAHFTMVRESLAVGGKYVVITPHRYAGPHDISRGFTRVASGLHLHEYLYSELFAKAKQHRFRVFAYYMRAGHAYRIPNIAPILYEKTMSTLPFVIRQPLARILWPQIMLLFKKAA